MKPVGIRNTFNYGGSLHVQVSYGAPIAVPIVLLKMSLERVSLYRLTFVRAPPGSPLVWLNLSRELCRGLKPPPRL